MLELSMIVKIVMLIVLRIVIQYSSVMLSLPLSGQLSAAVSLRWASLVQFDRNATRWQSSNPELEP